MIILGSTNSEGSIKLRRRVPVNAQLLGSIKLRREHQTQKGRAGERAMPVNAQLLGSHAQM